MDSDFEPGQKASPTNDIDLHMNQAHVLSVAYSSTDHYIAAGCSDALIRIVNTSTQHLCHKLNAGPSSAMPITCVRFRPTSHVANVLAASSADGSIQYFHVSTQQRLCRIDEPGNEIYAIDFDCNGTLLASGGHDGQVRLYDDNRKILLTTMNCDENRYQSRSHCSRVFCVKFSKSSRNTLISAGWDNTIQIWDIRTKNCQRTIFGPHIAGDALDFDDQGRILSGSWRPEQGLQLWDIATGRLVENIEWYLAPMIYSVSLRPGSGNQFCGGGSGTNKAAIWSTETVPKTKIVSEYQLSNQGSVFSCAFSNDAKQLCIAGGSPSIRLIKLGDKIL